MERITKLRYLSFNDYHRRCIYLGMSEDKRLGELIEELFDALEDREKLLRIVERETERLEKVEEAGTNEVLEYWLLSDVLTDSMAALKGIVKMEGIERDLELVRRVRRYKGLRFEELKEKDEELYWLLKAEENPEEVFERLKEVEINVAEGEKSKEMELANRLRNFMSKVLAKAKVNIERLDVRLKDEFLEGKRGIPYDGEKLEEKEWTFGKAFFKQVDAEILFIIERHEGIKESVEKAKVLAFGEYCCGLRKEEKRHIFLGNEGLWVWDWLEDGKRTRVKVKGKFLWVKGKVEG